MFGGEALCLPRREQRAVNHQLASHLQRAIRLSGHLYGMGATLTLGDRLYVRRLLARNGWGQETCKLTRFAFYVRSHWLRMPPAMLARHLWAKRSDERRVGKGCGSTCRSRW